MLPRGFTILDLIIKFNGKHGITADIEESYQ